MLPGRPARTLVPRKAADHFYCGHKYDCKEQRRWNLNSRGSDILIKQQRMNIEISNRIA